HTYATGIAMLPTDHGQRAAAIELIERIAKEEGLILLGWRDVPVAPDAAEVGPTARSVMPHFTMPFVAAQSDGAGRCPAGVELDRITLCLRKRVEHESVTAGCGVYFPSLSARTIVYKGMLTTAQLPVFFPDLTDRRLTSAIALVHSRFSTNTFPS